MCYEQEPTKTIIKIVIIVLVLLTIGIIMKSYAAAGVRMSATAPTERVDGTPLPLAEIANCFVYINGTAVSTVRTPVPAQMSTDYMLATGQCVKGNDQFQMACNDIQGNISNRTAVVMVGHDVCNVAADPNAPPAPPTSLVMKWGPHSNVSCTSPTTRVGGYPLPVSEIKGIRLYKANCSTGAISGAKLTYFSGCSGTFFAVDQTCYVVTAVDTKDRESSPSNKSMPSCPAI